MVHVCKHEEGKLVCACECVFVYLYLCVLAHQMLYDYEAILIGLLVDFE